MRDYLVDFAKTYEGEILSSGDLRAITDFEYELQMAQTNHKLEENVETMFLDNQSGVFLSQFYNSKRSGSLLVGIYLNLYRKVVDTENTRENTNTKGEM